MVICNYANSKMENGDFQEAETPFRKYLPIQDIPMLIWLGIPLPYG
jgi:hypothetical protein